jgi:hypothetical protein
METTTYSAFAGDKLVGSGALAQMLTQAKAHVERAGEHGLLIFEDQTGKQVDFDFRGTAQDVVARATEPARAGPGRPKLGVVAREVTLLPAQWAWLESQPSGASAALRRLVDDARKREPHKERARKAKEAASRFMTAMAGDRPNYEEASRALFAGDGARFAELIKRWPKDVRGHLERVAKDAF